MLEGYCVKLELVLLGKLELDPLAKYAEELYPLVPMLDDPVVELLPPVE